METSGVRFWERLLSSRPESSLLKAVVKQAEKKLGFREQLLREESCPLGSLQTQYVSAYLHFVCPGSTGIEEDAQ